MLDTIQSNITKLSYLVHTISCSQLLKYNINYRLQLSKQTIKLRCKTLLENEMSDIDNAPDDEENLVPYDVDAEVTLESDG